MQRKEFKMLRITKIMKAGQTDCKRERRGRLVILVQMEQKKK